MGGPEMGAHTQCTRDALCGAGKTGKRAQRERKR